MSVPTHNLYEFVHQVTEKKTFVAHFYPWGEKSLDKLILAISTHKHNVFEETDRDNIFFKKTLPGEIAEYVPIMICHDQEPLHYNLYDDFHTQTYRAYFQKEYPHHDVSRTNLRLKYYYDWNQYCILLHSEKQSKELKKYESTGEYIGAHWFSHAFIARDWFRFAEHDLDLQPATNIKKIFLTYCRDTSGSRQYRKQFVDLVNNNKNLTNQCQFKSFDNSIALSESSAIYNNNDFNCTMISVILETIFEQRIHLTEKTLRPIACGHPFILLNGPGSLEYLKSYGFKTFSPYINESYNNINDSILRMQAVINEMNRITKLSKQEQVELNNNLQKIADYNKKLFFSDDFYNQIINELKTNFNTAYKQIKYKMSWKNRWKSYKQKKKVHPKYFKENINERRLLLTLIRHLKKGGTLENYVPPNLD